jgi:tetratricopeptide (TPR) repeat protein
MAKGIRRKELKEPDEFLTLSKRFVDYAREHERKLTGAVLAVVGIGTLALGARWYRAWQFGKAEAAFGAARLELAAQRLPTAAEQFARVSADWPSSPYGKLALVYLGNCYAELGKDSEAREAYTKALANADDPLARQIANYNLGILEAKAGDHAAAAKNLGAAAEAEGPLRGAAWFARLSHSEQFVEDISQGMQAIDELGPDARDYVDAQIVARAKGGAK